MFSFYLSDVLMITTNEDFSSVYNFIEESTCFMGCKEFFFTNRMFQFFFVVSWKGADYVFITVDFLCYHSSHGIFLGGTRIDDESFVQVAVCAKDGIRNGSLDLHKS